MKDNEELRGVLNSGHTKVAANVIRNVEINGEHKPRRFSTWAAKAIATIRSLADTLEDRSVIITLQRKLRNANVERLRRRDTEEFQKLRSQAARWAADNFCKLVDPNPVVPEVLNDRASDNWRPLLAIADLAGGAWPEDARRAACLLSGEEQDGAVNIELLRDIRVAFGDVEDIRSADLVAKLTSDPERPWAEWKHGRPLSPKQLAGLLKSFCIISTTVHPHGAAHGKGYRRADFEAAWDSYCPGQNTLPAQSGASDACKRASSDEMGTTRDFRSVREDTSHASKNGKLSHSYADLHGWTGNERRDGGQSDFDPETGAADDPADDFPAFLRRCAYCNRNGALGRVALSDWPGAVWLHRECEGAWLKAATDKQTS